MALGRAVYALDARAVGVAAEETSCFTWEEREAYQAGYNQTVRSHTAATFGEGEFDRTWDEVQRSRLPRPKG